jgi:aspartyl-tRNA(Asn)/glutamyl-tRNA(Gln) amidotransferase subunit A
LVNLYSFKAWELRDLLVKREVSAAEILAAVLERVGRVEKEVHSYLTLTEREAEEAAARAGAPYGANRTNNAWWGVSTRSKARL